MLNDAPSSDRAAQARPGKRPAVLSLQRRYAIGSPLMVIRIMMMVSSPAQQQIALKRCIWKWQALPLSLPVTTQR